MAPPLTFPFEVLDATGCLHQRGILHRDLATKNVLPGKPKWKVSQQKLKTWDLHFGYLWKNFTQWNEEYHRLNFFTFDGVWIIFDLIAGAIFVMESTCSMQQGSTSVERSKFVTLASRVWPLVRTPDKHFSPFFRSWDLEKWMSWPMNFGTISSLNDTQVPSVTVLVGKTF